MTGFIKSLFGSSEESKKHQLVFREGAGEFDEKVGERAVRADHEARLSALPMMFDSQTLPVVSDTLIVKYYKVYEMKMYPSLVISDQLRKAIEKLPSKGEILQELYDVCVKERGITELYNLGKAVKNYARSPDEYGTMLALIKNIKAVAENPSLCSGGMFSPIKEELKEKALNLATQLPIDRAEKLQALQDIVIASESCPRLRCARASTIELDFGQNPVR